MLQKSPDYLGCYNPTFSSQHYWDSTTLACNFMLAELRRHVQNLWAGRTVHRLRPEQGSFKIAYKVMLLNNDEEIPALVFLI